MGTAAPTFSGNELIVILAGVPDRQRLTVTATGVNGSASASTPIGFLIGDINASRGVNAADIGAVKARQGQAVDGANFRSDLNADGRIDLVDVAAVQARSGSVLP